MREAALDRKRRIAADTQLATGATCQFVLPIGTEPRLDRGMAGQQERSGLHDPLGLSQQQPRRRTDAVLADAMQEALPFETRDQLDETEAVHRGAFVRPVGKCAFERLVDRAPVGLCFKRRKVDAYGPGQIEAAQRAGQRRGFANAERGVAISPFG